MQPAPARQPTSADSKAGTSALAEGFHRAPDWSRLKVGDRVVIRSRNHPPAAGTVDAVAYDGSMFWMLPDGGLSRRIYCRSDNEKIWAFAKAR